MSTPRRMSFLVLLAVCLSATAVWSVRGLLAEDAISVQVTVLAHDGSAVEGAVVHVVSRAGDYFVRTDADGVALINAAVTGGEEVVWARLVWQLGEYAPAEEAEVDRARYRTLLTNNRFRSEYPVALQPGTTEYALAIAGIQAVQVSGRVVNAHGAPIVAAVSVLGALESALAAPDTGEFVVSGAPKNQTAYLYVSSSHSPVRRVIRLEAEQTGEDFTVGDVVIPDLQGGAPVQITVTNRLAATTALEMYSGVVSLIAVDGSLIIGLPVGESGLASVIRDSPQIPHVPPGEYFVMAGSAARSVGGARLLAAIRNGLDLTNSGIPRINALDGQLVVLSIDAAQVRDALFALPPIE